MRTLRTLGVLLVMAISSNAIGAIVLSGTITSTEGIEAVEAGQLLRFVVPDFDAIAELPSLLPSNRSTELESEIDLGAFSILSRVGFYGPRLISSLSAEYNTFSLLLPPNGEFQLNLGFVDSGDPVPYVHALIDDKYEHVAEDFMPPGFVRSYQPVPEASSLAMWIVLMASLTRRRRLC